MNQLQKYTWLIGLAVMTGGLMPAHSYAKDMAQESSTHSTKITGSLKIKSEFALADEEARKSNKYTFKIGSAEIGLKKTFPWGKDTVEFVIQSKILKYPFKPLGIKKVYVDHKNFIVGLTNSNFCDPSAELATLIGSPVGTASARVVKVGWKDRLQKGLSYGIAAEKAKELNDSDPMARHGKLLPNVVYKGLLPAVGAHMKYEEAFGYLRVSALLRPIDHNPKEETHYKYAWGVNLTGTLNIIPEQTSLKIGGIYGMGIGSYLTVPHKEQLLDTDGYNSEEKLVLVGARGGYLGLEHRWLPKLRSTLALGIIDTADSKEREKNVPESLHNSCFKQARYASVNLTYHPTENLTLGAEYIYGKTSMLADEDIPSRHDIGLAVKFKL
ncbi:MAG: DcaP family trimeric outer membrane transporter [Bacteroidota bacterium]